MKKSKRNKKGRGPYRCTNCREYGHRADKCPNAHKYETLLNSLPGDAALAGLIPDDVQILTVLDGHVSTALTGAIRGNERLVARGMPPSNSVINAWTELSVRAVKIKPSQISAARAAREARDKAEAAYQAALAPIRVTLGHEKGPRK